MSRVASPNLVAERGVDVTTERRGLDRATWSLALLAFIAGFAQFGAVTALADVAEHFGHVTASTSLTSQVGLSGSEIGLGLALLRLASLGALPLASLADRWGRTRLVRHTMWVGLLCTAAAALSPSYWFFVGCFALGRPLLSTVTALVQVTAVELAPATRRVGRLAVIAAGGGAGSGFSAILHGALHGASSFRWLFAAALVPLVVLAPLMRGVPEPPTRDHESLARLGAVPSEFRVTLWRVAVVVALLGLIAGPANGFVFVYGESVLHLSAGHVAVLVSCASVTGRLGLLASRAGARRWGRRRTIALGVVISALAATLAYGGDVRLFVVGYLLGVGAGGLVTPVVSALGTEIFPHHVRATAAGWLAVAGIVGAVVGLAAFGVLADVLHQSGASALRWPAAITFLSPLGALVSLRPLPERGAVELE